MPWHKLLRWRLRWPKALRGRYSLRALLVFITLFMVWGGYHTNRSWKERAAENVLRRYGATFDYDKPIPKQGAWNHVVFGYHMLVRVLWGERFINCVTINSQLESELVDALCALSHLETLNAQPERVVGSEFVRRQMQSDFEPTVRPPAGAISQILANKNLKSLTLCVWILSDEDCAAVAHDESLEQIAVFGCEISENSLTRLVSKPGLRNFSFSFCPVTGDKLTKVNGSKTLEAISCEAAPVGKELAAFIARSPKVSQMMCRSWTVNDEFVAALGPHPSLKCLDVPLATDRSIPFLKQMPALEMVILSNTSMSNEALEELRRARPNLDVRTVPFPKYWEKEDLK